MTAATRTVRSTWSGVVHLLTAGVVGVVVAWAVPTAYAAHRDAEIAEQRVDPPPVARLGDRTRTALAEVRQDGVYVSPDGRSLMDEAGERRVEQAVAANPLPVYVIVWAEGQEIGNNVLNLQDVLAEELGPDPGVLYLWQGPQSGAAEQVGADDVRLEGMVSQYDFVGDAADFLTGAVAQVSVDEAYSDLTDDEDRDDGPGVVGGGVGGAFLGLGIVAVGLLVGAVARAMRGRGLLPGRWRWTEEAR